MTPKDEDPILIVRPQNEDDITALIRKYQRWLRFIAIRILGIKMSPGAADVEAEDVLQEVFMAVFMSGTQGVKSLEAFLFTIVRNRALNRVRKGGVQEELDENIEDVRLNLEIEIERRECSDWLERLISGMSREDQGILRFYIAGYSMQQIARMLDISVSAARARLHRARARLSQKAKEEHLNL